MAAQKGSALLLKATLSGSLTTLAGLRSTSMSINGEMVDVTTKDSNPLVAGGADKAREILDQTMGVLFDKMKKHVDNGGKLNEYLWEEDEPCYGSDAYCDAYGF